MEPAGRRSLPSPVPEGEPWRDHLAKRPGTAGADRAVFGRRRLIAGLVVVVVVGLAGVIAVVLLRGGGQAPVTPVSEPIASPAPGETRPSPSPAPTTPSTSSPTTTAPSTSGHTFTLPEGTKLQRGEGDAALIRELQQALSAAGYDPGPADGTFGQRTEAAVVAFQEANRLSVDGRVGPETATALDSALDG